jgi:hypothetical protein
MFESVGRSIFLLSRIREQWDRTGDNTIAVAAARRAGCPTTGRPPLKRPA